MQGLTFSVSTTRTKPDAAMDHHKSQPIDVAGSFLRAVAGARSDRNVAKAREERDAQVDEIISSFPSLDDRANDWPDRLVAAADRHIAPSAAEDEREPQERRGTMATHALRERRDCQRVDITACIDVISAIGAVVHAVVDDADGNPRTLLYCSDGARRFIFTIEIVFARQSPTDHGLLGAHIGPLVLLNARRLLAIDGSLCVPERRFKIGGGWESRMWTAAATVRFLTDLIQSDAAVTDWPEFAAARYAELDALPDALARRGWTIVPDNGKSAHRHWRWTGESRVAELCSMALTIVRPGAPRLSVVWSSGRITVTNQKYSRGSDTIDLPLFFDPPGAHTRTCQDDPMEMDTHDWRLVSDRSNVNTLLERERAWMADRGYVSQNVVAAGAKGFYDGDCPPLILGRMGDTADQMASRVESYLAYVSGAYGPVDPATGAHLNGHWCQQRMTEALFGDTEKSLRDGEGPIDPAGPVVTNWYLSHHLNSAFNSVRSVNVHDLPEIVAHAHLVGESSGAASAHFAVIVQGPYHADAGPPKAGSPRAILIDALKTIPIDSVEGTSSISDGVHPLVARNARTLCLSDRTDLVLYQSHVSGDDVGLVRAHAWIVARVKAAIRLFRDVAATLVPASSP